MEVLRSLFGEDAKILAQRDFQVLLLANIVGPLGTALLSPVLDSLIAPLGANPSNIGLIISSFTAPAIVVIPIIGILADRFGRKPILVISLLLFGLAGSAIAFTTDFFIVLCLRFLQGLAFGGVVPVIITSIGDIYTGTEEATAQGIRFTGSGLTQVVFPLLSGLLVAVAWQYPFLLYAVSFPVAFCVYVFLDEPSKTGSSGTSGTDGREIREHLHALFGLARRRQVAPLLIARGLMVVVWFGFLTYNSIIIIQVLGGTSAQSGLLVALGSLTYAISGSQSGRITAIFATRLYPLIGANVCLGLGFIVFLIAPSFEIAVIGVIIAGSGFGLIGSMYRSIITSLASDELRGGLVSLGEALGRVFATATPVFMGLVIAVATPIMGLGPAVQVAGFCAAIIGSAGGVICLVFANVTESDAAIP